jgi:acyl-CoA thioesterase I
MRAGVFNFSVMPLLLLAATLTLVAFGGEPGLAAFSKDDRVVFLGDSITDGFTHPLLMQQALVEAGLPAPAIINAGIGGDTAEGMLARLDRDVLPHRPTLVALSVGINDILRSVKFGDYQARVTAIADRMQREKIPMLLMTTTVLEGKHAPQDKLLDEYNAFLRSLARERGYRVADINAVMQQARAAGRKDMIEADCVHLTYAGYRVMTRALLDGLGYASVAVPEEIKLDVYPGLITNWRMRVAPHPRKSLDAAEVAMLSPDDKWIRLTLPSATRETDWWPEHERRRGAALSLDRDVGKAERYHGMTTITAEKARNVVFSVGANLDAIWLNGKRIYKVDGWKGWHLGRERVKAELATGANTLVIETGPQFILTMTDE